jgi:hypothetical protein
MGAASLLSDSGWREAFGEDDVEALADAVLDLVVHRSRDSERDSATARKKASKTRKAS